MLVVVSVPLGVTASAVARMLGPDAVSVSGIVQSIVLSPFVVGEPQVTLPSVTSGDAVVSAAVAPVTPAGSCTMRFCVAAVATVIGIRLLAETLRILLFCESAMNRFPRLSMEIESVELFTPKVDCAAGQPSPTLSVFAAQAVPFANRSEERRVGKEGRAR